MLTQAELKKYVHYDPLTGIFTRLIATCGKIKVGQVAGNKSNQDGYLEFRVLRREYKAHRLAWLYMFGYFPPQRPDHKNGIRTDNRIDNIRPATHNENAQYADRSKTNTSGYLGVSFCRATRKWKAQCQSDGVKYYLGVHRTKEAAAKAYRDFAAQHHGEFCYATSARALI